MGVSSYDLTKIRKFQVGYLNNGLEKMTEYIEMAIADAFLSQLGAKYSDLPYGMSANDRCKLVYTRGELENSIDVFWVWYPPGDVKGGLKIFYDLRGVEDAAITLAGTKKRKRKVIEAIATARKIANKHPPSADSYCLAKNFGSVDLNC